MKYSGADVWIMLDGYELTGYALEFTPPAPEARFEDSHTFGDSWREQLPVSMVEWAASVSGFFDDESAGLLEAIGTRPGDSGVMGGYTGQSAGRVLAWGVAGTTPGVPAGGGTVRQTTWTPTAARGALTKGAAQFTGEGRLAGNSVLLRKGTITGTSGDGTGVDNGALTSNGGVATFMVTVTAGNVVQKVKHSTDNSTYADLATATSVGTGTDPAGQQVTVAGTVNRWLRQNFTNSVSPYTGAVLFERL